MTEWKSAKWQQTNASPPRQTRRTGKADRTEGTDSSQGTPQLLSNISACLAVAQTIATTLGPRGMDKLIVDERGNATISSQSSGRLFPCMIIPADAQTTAQHCSSFSISSTPLHAPSWTLPARRTLRSETALPPLSFCKLIRHLPS